MWFFVVATILALVILPRYANQRAFEYRIKQLEPLVGPAREHILEKWRRYDPQADDSVLFSFRSGAQLVVTYGSAGIEGGDWLWERSLSIEYPYRTTTYSQDLERADLKTWAFTLARFRVEPVELTLLVPPAS